MEAREIGGIGFLAGLVTLVFNTPPAVMLNLFFFSTFLGTIAEGAIHLVLSRKGG